MLISAIQPDAALEDGSLLGLQANIATVAGLLDARFVKAGTSLAQAYEIVERLVGALERITSALDRDAADAAMENMRKTADRLTRLPEIQRDRRNGLASVDRAGAALKLHIRAVGRTIDYLRACGLNIKVAASGSEEFEGFVNLMFEKLDIGEEQMSDLAREIGALDDQLAAMSDLDKQLEKEGARVVPEVPRKLAADAEALQRHQAEVGAVAARIADVARDIRTKVATALGALQIGDITRQRLEHVAEGLQRVHGVLAGQTDLSADHRRAIEGHVANLLSAQAIDTISDFQREARLLASALLEIGPQARTLLEIGSESDPAGDDSFLGRLELSIAGVANVTERLRDADGQCERLSLVLAEAAISLAARLRTVRKVQDDVQQMAWNTDLRCRRMGNEARALAVIARDIRSFSKTLEVIAHNIGASFDELAAGAAAIRGEADDNAVGALADSLACIRDGGKRMADGMAGLGGEASSFAEIVRQTTENVDCEAEFAPALSRAVDGLGALAGSEAAELSEEPEALLRDILEGISNSYTMAREREIHRRFGLNGEADENEAELSSAMEEISDDDLFDDALF